MRRRECIFQALLPSGSEHRLLMGFAREAKIWDAVKNVAPNVTAVNLTAGGCGWLHAAISIEKQIEGDSKNVILAAFAAHPSLKHVVVVDSDVNIYDPVEVEWAIATRFQGDKGLIVLPHMPGSTLDPSGDQETGMTTKIGIDATMLSQFREKFMKGTIPFDRSV